MEREQKKQLIIDYLNDSETAVDKFYELLEVQDSKNWMLKYAGYTDKQLRQVDSAIPQPYADRIREIYPQFDGIAHGYDYSDKGNPYGQMLNILQEFGRAVLIKFNNLT